MCAEESRAVDVTAVFYEKERKPPRPWRFWIEDEAGERRTFRIDHVITVEERRFCHLTLGYDYRCRCRISGRFRELDFEYTIEDATWRYRGGR